jgi:mRNA-degrading endonuclease RelE of RelBE toxin-antitoxin system
VDSYLVDVIPTAQKELKWLAPALVARIYPRLENLAANPRPPGCKKLKGGENELRIPGQP